MKLGSSTFCWKDEPLTPDLLEQLAKAGVEEVEIADYHPNFDYFGASWLKATGEAARNAGLSVATVHTHLAHRDPQLVLMHPDPTRRRRAVEAYFRAVDALSLIGACCLLTHDVQLQDAEADDPAERERTIAAVREVADYAQAAGMTLVIENLPKGWSSNVTRIAGLVEAIAHPAVKLCFDTAHAARRDDPVRAMKLAAKHTRVIHVNDADGGKNHILPGRGRIDWAGVMTAAAAADHAPHFIYELSDPADIPHLRENFKRLANFA